MGARRADEKEGYCIGEPPYCTDPDCPVCTLWPKDGESMEEWLARLKEIARKA